MTEKHILEYESIRPSLLRFTKKLETLIHDILSEKQITVHLIESRTKDVSSFRNKISRENKSYEDPIREITDLCGIRVIAYYEDQVKQIEDLIRAEFSIDEENSLIHTRNGAEFGYKSSHFIIKINNKRSDLVEWNFSSNLTAEIQVRTVLQHAWAAISHKLQYKLEADVPNALKRKLFRLSALFELADDEFISLRDASHAVKEDIVNQLTEGNRKIPLDAYSLNELLETSAVMTEISADAADAGFNFDVPEYDPEYPSDDSERISDLLRLANIAGLKTVEDFDSMLNNAVEWSREYLLAQYKANKNISPGNWFVTNSFICELILLHAYHNSIRLGHLLVAGYSRESAKRIHEVAQSFKKANK